ncbi:MAG: hypothetical protein HOJ15_04385 [Candidatus Jacksonbacteria bacterium]|mgnify:CR=1 FL=1|jgi:UDP-2,3-diacylglucosamine pyrophosphatase LpxH|nr:hypothetical protein [Candidatus Jacksonbacteria bacterium]MBT6301637.1 hypothetical protein [Candidatus Jacksonbacteria bacterium]MBT6757475.1 hypothetical protein [Candidatus Jacksonbacteria bacterium]MBT6955224.1 hypothetical protein [Candidatus Jacksonbacteria bacterium]MBT7008049.1 hypothetical protein [Candidatus Jacksonbacteria bacterium]
MQAQSPLSPQQEGVELAVISDLHLGGPLTQVIPLLRMLKSLKLRKDGVLLINGDLLNLHGKRLADVAAIALLPGHVEVLARIAEIAITHKVVAVAGNHDPIVDLRETLQFLSSTELFGRDLSGLRMIEFRRKPWIWYSNGHKLVAVHGHQFDNPVVTHSRFAPIVTRVFEWLVRRDIGKKTITKWLSRVVSPWSAKKETFIEAALQFAENESAHILLCGHRHDAEAEWREHQGRHILLVDLGCWTDRPPTWVTIADGVLRLHGLPSFFAYSQPTIRTEVPIKWSAVT